MSYPTVDQCRTTKREDAIVITQPVQAAGDGSMATPVQVCVKDIWHAAIEGDVECLEANIRLGGAAAVFGLGQPCVESKGTLWGPMFDRCAQFTAAPLHYACAFNREAAVRCLLSHGARSDQMSSTGTTARDYARQRGYENILAILDGRQ
jgi:hypothetical protein